MSWAGLGDTEVEPWGSRVADSSGLTDAPHTGLPSFPVSLLPHLVLAFPPKQTSCTQALVLGSSFGEPKLGVASPLPGWESRME